MKKQVLTTAIVLTLGLGAFAQQGDGLLMRSESRANRGDRLTTPSIPQGFGITSDENADPAPLGSGIAVLVGLGAAYAMMKRKEK